MNLQGEQLTLELDFKLTLQKAVALSCHTHPGAQLCWGGRGKLSFSDHASAWHTQCPWINPQRLQIKASAVGEDL